MNSKAYAILFAVLLIFLAGPLLAAEDEADEVTEEKRGLSITISNDEEDPAYRAEIAERVIEEVQQEVDRALQSLPDDLGEVMSEADREQFEADLERLRNLRNLDQVQDLDDLDINFNGDSGMVSADDIAGILAIIMVFGMPIMIVAIVSYNGRRKREMVHQTIDRIVEQGGDVPMELLDALDKGKGTGDASLRRAVVNIALGAGLGVFLGTVAGVEVATIALIPFFIGLAYLLIWWLEHNREDMGAV
jgi:hypothetical protein